MTPERYDDRPAGGSRYMDRLRAMPHLRDGTGTSMVDDLMHRIFACAGAGSDSPLDDLPIDRFVARLIGDGWSSDGNIPVETIIAAARRLGDGWNDDSCSFWDVTIGMARLSQELMLIDKMASTTPLRMRGRVLLAVAPGDQHSFGIAVVATAMRRAGWDVVADVPNEAAALIDAVRRESFEIVGLSVGHERALAPTADLIGALRTASRNRGIRVALGGAILNGRAELARALGADLHADDAAGFVEAADATLLELA